MPTRAAVIALLALLLAASCLAWTPLGDCTGYSVQGREVTVSADSASLRITFYRADIVRVDYYPGPSAVFDSSLVVVQDTSDAPLPGVADLGDELTINAGGISVHVAKYPVRLEFRGSGGESLAEPPDGGLGTEGAQRIARFETTPGEHFYGTGERCIGLDLRGRSFDSYNVQPFGYSQPRDQMNINVPLLVSSQGYGIYFENTWPGHFDLGDTDPDQFSYTCQDGELSLYVIDGGNVPGVLEGYTWLTGRPPLPPKWAFGYIQSKYGYRNESAARNVVNLLRGHDIPVDGLVLDLYWFNQMGDFAWDAADWPDPAGMIDDFAAQGIHTVVITEPYFTEYSLHYGLLTTPPGEDVGRTAAGEPYVLNNWWSCGCDAVLLDMTRPSARTWLRQRYSDLLGDGLAGFWTDLGEPEFHPVDMWHAAGPAEKVHNVFNLLWARTVAEAFAETRPDERLFNLTRSGYAGIQRYGVFTWSGDVSRSFDGLALQRSILLNAGLSGLGYHGSDTGGFTGVSSGELYARWMQLSAFSPVTRAHGYDNQPTEPWGFGTEVENACRKVLDLRYQLLPYLYSMAWKNHQTGLPIVRPLFLAEPDNPVFADELDAYLFGDLFVVAPVVQAGQTNKTFRLPSGNWVNWWIGEVVAGGGEVTVYAPLDRIPLFVKSGSILPMAPLRPSTDAIPPDTLILASFPDPAVDSEFSLYEDDGHSLGYEQGMYSETRLSQHLETDGGLPDLTVRVEAATGAGYEGQPEVRSVLLEVFNVNALAGEVTRNGAMLVAYPSLEELRGHESGFAFDASHRRLYVQVPDSLRRTTEVAVHGIDTAVDESTPARPSGYTLLPNRPNPFNSSTILTFTLPVTAPVRLTVYDVLGREVRTLVDSEQGAGRHEIAWDGRNNAGALAGSGFYICRMKAGSYTGTIKMLLVK